jgi:hypothetical protein
MGQAARNGNEDGSQSQTCGTITEIPGSPENFSKIVPGVEPGNAEAILPTIQSNKNGPAQSFHRWRP